MLCFIIPKRDYDLSVKGRLKVEPNCVCIGNINEVSEAYAIANHLPCLTEVIVEKGIIPICLILANP